MESKNILPEEIDVLLCNFMRSPLFRILLLRQYRQQPNLFEDHYAGNVDPSVLMQWIQFCAHSCLGKKILYPIVDAIDGKSISDEIFNMLLAFPKRSVRQMLIVSLCHKHLSVNQLKALCAIGQCFECFFALVVRQYQDCTATTDDFRDAVKIFLNSKYTAMSEDLWTELRAVPCEDPAKRAMLELYSGESKDSTKYCRMFSDENT